MKVYIQGGNSSYAAMYRNRKWQIADTVSEADLIQFCGGEDVSPLLYGEPELRVSCCNFDRDVAEMVTFGHALDAGVPMAGICRGGQFLNVMCGGRMFQDANGHCGPHDVVDLDTGEVFQATSTHHQMMIGGPSATLVATAYPAISTRRETAELVEEGKDLDTEVLFYRDQKVLCFQPHPEFHGREALSDRYFGYIKRYLGVSA